MLQGLLGCKAQGPRDTGEQDRLGEERETVLRRVYLRKLLSWACSTAVEPAGPSAQEPQAHSARGAMQPSTRCEVTWEAQESLQRRLASRRPASCLREVCLDAALFVLIGIKTT